MNRTLSQPRVVDAAVVGAGPYGLAAAAHLQAAGIDTRVFGDVMEFWRRNMPKGMLLRSAWEASHIADPDGTRTLDRYQTVALGGVPTPVPLECFIEYGRWYQREVVPGVDQRKVVAVEGASDGFQLVLDDGERTCARRVVIATGLGAFSWRPRQFDSLPSSLVSHSSEHDDLSGFAGRRVLVIGSGQSALESAALLHEAGADVEVTARALQIHWLRGAWLRTHLGPLRPLLYPSTDVGPPGLNWIVAKPGLLRTLPVALQEPIARRSIRPAGAAWLPDRLTDVRIRTGRTVVSALPSGGRLKVRLDEGTVLHVDHVLLATGYRADVARCAFLARELIRSLRRHNGGPRLDAGFQSSVEGLYFLGALAAETFGPLMRFVSGTGYAARGLTRRILGKTAARARSQDGA